MKKILTLAAMLTATLGFANDQPADSTQNVQTPKKPICCACPHSHDSQEEHAQVEATEEVTDASELACGNCKDKGKN